MTPPMDDALQVRAPGWWVSVVVVLLIAPGYWLILTGRRGDPTMIRALFALLAIGMIVSMVLVLRNQVTASADGLVARLPYGRMCRFRWDEVHRFGMGGYRRGVGLWTVDGRWVKLLPYGLFEAKAQALVYRLETYRWHRQQQLGLV